MAVVAQEIFARDAERHTERAQVMAELTARVVPA